ncbi:MAG: heavy metal translocating P-type ATPase [Deltaproteobacteria bacterium]|nr:heavy metal translocating P-type ATPase [Deltaproteobacteria bacterium]
MAEGALRSQEACALCGLPAGGSRIERAFGGEPRRFCCTGCLHVFDLLFHRPEGPPADFRGTDVYRACEALGVVAPGDASSPAARLDEGAGAELGLSIEGMWCSACAWVLEEVLRKTPGVLDVSVRFVSDAARIRYLPHRVTAEELLGVITGLGYGGRYPEEPGPGEGRALLLRVGLAAILSMYTMMLSLVLYGGFFAELGREAVLLISLLLWLLSTPAVFFCGAPLLRRAWSSVRAGVPTMDVLVGAGALSAYAYSLVQLGRGSLHLYFDTAATLVAVVLFGRYLELRAKERISARVRELQELARGKARVRAPGGERWVSSSAVSPGDELVVREGETVPVDGRLLAGPAQLDEAVLTGESRPVVRGEGEPVRAGARVLEGDALLRADRPGSESSLRLLAREVEDALGRKGRAELLADRLTRRLVPGVLLLSAGCAVWLLLSGAAAEEALLRALAVLVITCPCALGIATPLAKVAAVAKAREEGLLVRDPAALELAGRVDTVVFDKTGTLTEGRFTLRELSLRGAAREEALTRIASAEVRSSHYLAREILRRARAEGIEPREPDSFQALEGLGIRATVEGREVLVGNRRLLASSGWRLPADLDEEAADLEARGLTAVFGAWEGEGRALLAFGDVPKPGAGEAVSSLAAAGVEVWLLSGDSPATTAAVAEALGIGPGARRGGASPEEKVALVRELRAQGRRLAMVGDGLNDAAALALADIGFAVGSEGSSGAWQAADVALLSDDPRRVLAFRALALRTSRILRQNLFFAFAYNALAIPLALAGTLNPLVAAAAMVASSLTVVASTARISTGSLGGYDGGVFK